MKESLVQAIQHGMDAAVRMLYKSKRGSCAIEGCPNEAIAKGKCNAHYLRAKQGKDLLRPVQIQADKCIDCEEPIKSKGGWLRCAKHFKLARQRVIKTALVEAMGGCCQKCGGTFSLAVYDFHHVGKKDANPSELIANASVEKIAEEIENCVLLCANCHRVEHETRF